MAAEPAAVYHAVCLFPRKSPATGTRARTQEEFSLEYQEERMREWGKAGAERAEGLERSRETAVLRALTLHRVELLASRPWDTERDRDTAMQGLVAALDVRVVVQRPPGPSKTQRATWGVFVQGQHVAGEVREWTGPPLRLGPHRAPGGGAGLNAPANAPLRRCV